MKWNENEELWSALDDLMMNCKDDLNKFLGILHQHQNELDMLGQAIMFGGIGKLVLMYNQFRTEYEPEIALALAFKEMHSDRRVQTLIGHSVNMAIDARVENMKEGN
tara:strand:+ start:309 stop:629 length:321 start_codon:yes stop_codon:yes gene_type:complete